jgi:hypothetical protein
MHVSIRVEHQRASGSLLSGDKTVRPTEEDLKGKVPAQFAAQGTLNGDGLERKFLPA